MTTTWPDSNGGWRNFERVAMELKEVILSTIAEIGEEVAKSAPSEAKKRPETDEGALSKESKKTESFEDEKALAEKGPTQKPKIPTCADADFIEEERQFLEHMRERILVLFEGFQSPNNKRVEAKIDLTLNFLEYLLASLDERIDSLKSHSKR
jgi:metal-dependent hydrolase (beta-lactamase superfamily II)